MTFSFLDVKKMPLGKLSKTQIARGFEVLEELEKAVDSKNKKKMMELSSKFYTVIPHDFGRRVPPVMDTLEIIRQKYDMLLVGTYNSALHVKDRGKLSKQCIIFATVKRDLDFKKSISSILFCYDIILKHIFFY